MNHSTEDSSSRDVNRGTQWLGQRVAPRLVPLWRRGFRVLFLLDALALYALMALINLVRFGTDWPTYPLSHYWIGFGIATLIHVVVNYFTGLYEREPRLGQRPWLPRVVLAMAIGIGVDGVAFVVLDRYLMPRLNLGVLFVLGSLVLVASRHFSRSFSVRWQGPPRIVLVGRPDDIASVTTHLAQSDRAAEVVATINSTDQLVEAVHTHRATDVLLLDVDAFGRVFPEPISSLELEGVGFLQRVGAQETMLGLQSVREVAGMPFVRLRLHTLPSHKMKLKRGFDLVLLLVLSPIALVVTALLALYVRLRAGAPVIYRQERIGRGGDPFTLMKFRTMRVDAEKDGAMRSHEGDSRVVKCLGWMRATRADELPQLWNVLTGEMSLVGPRPERPEFIAEISAAVPGFERRHELRPGLTGLAQVQGRYETDAAFKVGHDLQYLVNWSLALDVQILLRTVWVV
ncbi:MAG: exopolysaccharide biosynthesis polyprenyl glycosylphosphotransferase, partial [Actinomycetota bacterium]